MASTAYPTEAQTVGCGRSELSDSLGRLDAFSHEKRPRLPLASAYHSAFIYTTVVRISVTAFPPVLLQDKGDLSPFLEQGKGSP